MDLHDAFGPLLRIDRRDVAGLLWCKRRAQMWRDTLRRRRKYAVPKGANFTQEESAVIETLADLEGAAGRLLTLMEQNQN